MLIDHILGLLLWALSATGGIDEQPVPAPALSAAEVEALVCAYDWPCEESLAIAHCESRYQTGAVSDTDDHGLFQINAGPSLDSPTYEAHYAEHGFTGWRAYFEAHGWGWLPYNAVWNTAAAYHIWDRGGFESWSCAKEIYP